MRRKHLLIVFISAFLLGFLLWVLSPLFIGRLEPWDSPYPVYSGTMIIGGTLITFFTSRQLLASYFGVWLGQALGNTLTAFLQPPNSEAQAWWPLGIFTAGIGSILILVGVGIGLAIKTVVGRRSIECSPSADADASSEG